MIESSKHKLAVLILLLVLPLWHGTLHVQQSDQPVITIFHGGCYGRCPVYTLDIYNDGRIRYIGNDFVLFRDTEYGRMSSDTVQSLMQETELVGFFKPDIILPPSQNGVVADATLIDAATTRITISHSGKTIRKDNGFTPLLLHIERATHVVRWTGILRDLDNRELDFGAKFPGADSLMNRMAYLDSLYHAGLDYDTWMNKRGEPGSEWHRRLVLYDQPRRDSVDKALKKYYRSLTDEQVDSLWRVENEK